MRTWLSLLLVLVFILPVGMALAQEPSPTPSSSGPVYIVQEGDTLWGIATRFGVGLDALAQANGLTVAGFLAVGQELLIPGLEGISGRLVTVDVPLGESLASLSRHYQTTPALLARLNHLTGPQSIFAGSNLVLPETSASQQVNGRAMLAPGQSLLELAVLAEVNSWTLLRTNQVSQTWAVLPGTVLDLPAGGQPGPGALPPEISAFQLEPAVLAQGKTNIVRIELGQAISLTGSLLGHAL